MNENLIASGAGAGSSLIGMVLNTITVQTTLEVIVYAAIGAATGIFVKWVFNKIKKLCQKQENL